MVADGCPFAKRGMIYEIYLMPAKYFFSFIISFIVGVALESVAGLGIFFAALLIVLSVVVILVRGVRSTAQKSFLVSLILFGVAVGVTLVDYSSLSHNTKALDSFVGKFVSVEGVVIDEPDVREEYTNIVLEVRAVLDDRESYVLNKGVLILVRLPQYPALRYGDEVTLTGKISTPKNFSAKNSGRSFDYRAYLAKEGIYYQMYFPKVLIVSNNKGNPVYEKLFVLKEVLMRNISRMIPDPESALAGGILLGVKQSLGIELLQKFRDTGVAHIVVLSGYNIAVVASAVSASVVFLPFTFRIVASVLGIILFAMMVGGGATVVRATIMVLVVILARATSREGDSLRALFLAGGLMVAVNPMILLYDVSFQLSFSATLSLIVLSPIIEKYFLFISQKILRGILVATVSAQIFVLPLLLYHIGTISLVSIIANLFILPVVPIGMLSAFLLSVFALMPILGSALAFVSYVILAYMIFAVELFSRVPFASLHNINFSLWMLVISYVLLAIFVIKNSPHTNDTSMEEKTKYDF